MTTTTTTPTPMPLKLHSFAEKEKIPMLHYHRTTPKWSMMRPQATFSFFISCLIMSFIRVSFKGCSWQPIPRHSRCVDWHTDGIVKCASSRAFNLYAWPRISFFPFDFHFYFFLSLKQFLAARDAVGDRFQHTPIVLTGIMIELLNSRDQGLSFGLLYYI